MKSTLLTHDINSMVKFQGFSTHIQVAIFEFHGLQCNYCLYEDDKHQS